MYTLNRLIRETNWCLQTQTAGIKHMAFGSNKADDIDQ